LNCDVHITLTTIARKPPITRKVGSFDSLNASQTKTPQIPRDTKGPNASKRRVTTNFDD